jgi:hypothetical protein
MGMTGRKRRLCRAGAHSVQDPAASSQFTYMLSICRVLMIPPIRADIQFLWQSAVLAKVREGI